MNERVNVCVCVQMCVRLFKDSGRLMMLSSLVVWLHHRNSVIVKWSRDSNCEVIAVRCGRG